MTSFHLLAIYTIGVLSGYGCVREFIHLAIDHETRYVWASPHTHEKVDWYISYLQQIFVCGIP